MKSLILLLMTKEQAHLFFPNTEEDDLAELWEQRLFEQKQFFLTRPPIQLVWISRLKKLEKQFQGYLLLSNQEKVEEQMLKVSENEVQFPLEFIPAFHQFHKHRIDYKYRLLQAQSYDSLVQVVNEWLLTEESYYQFWSLEESKDCEIEVIKSKEPDPMDLLKELKETEKLINSSLIKDLKENYNILPENVKKEVKRLTLLTKV